MIERRKEQKAAYSQEMVVNEYNANAYYTQGYLRSDAPAGKNFVPKEHRVGRMPGVKLDAHADLDSVQSQLRDAMVSMATTRVIDVFRCWDTDESGTISRKEFTKAMATLGLDQGSDEIEALFDRFDPDGSGVIEYKELAKALKPSHAARASRKPKATDPSPAGRTPAELKQIAQERSQRRKNNAR